MMLTAATPLQAWLAILDSQTQALQALEAWCRPSIQTPRRVRRLVEFVTLPATLSLSLFENKAR